MKDRIECIKKDIETHYFVMKAVTGVNKFQKRQAKILQAKLCDKKVERAFKRGYLLGMERMRKSMEPDSTDIRNASINGGKAYEEV